MRKFVAGLALGLGSAAVVLAIGAGGWLDRAEMATYDWRTKLTADHSPANPEIVLVEINDSSVRDLSPFYGRWPWPRLAFADLITYLNRAPATVIAVDFTFPEEQRDVTFKIGGAGGQSWTGEQSDKALVDAVRKANVILLADANYAGNQGGEQVVAVATWTSTFQHLGSFVEERPSIVPPFQALTDAGRGLAHNFLPLDSDGIARRMPPFVRTGDRALPFLGVAAAIAARDLRPDEIRVDAEALRMGDRTMPLVGEMPDPLDARRTHVQRTALVNYRTPAFLADGTRPFKTYEARHLLVSEDQMLSGAAPLVDPAEFKNKIVFVGQTLSGLVDVFQTPFGSNISGIQLHATVADSILSNRFMRPAGSRSRLVATVGAAGTGWSAGWFVAFSPSCRSDRSRSGRVDVVLSLHVSRRIMGEPGAAIAGDGGCPFCRHCISVLRRGSRKAKSQTPVRPIRVERRLQSASRASRKGGVGRRPSRDDGFVLGHPRVHVHNREGQS